MSIDFNRLLMLAPLAGWSDLPFRSMVKKFGVDLTVSEMISSYALSYNPQKTLHMIQKSPLENPFSVQIAGNNVEIIRRSIEILNTQDGIDVIDLNCGCPAPKVSSHGNGSGLLKNLNLLVDLVNTIKMYSNKPYTSLKVRLGFDKKIPLELAHAISDSGADFVVVHGRTKIDAYKKDKIDYDSITLIKQHIKIPLIANGEIDSVQSAENVMCITGADGVMIGRGALKSPWIFYQIKHGELPAVLKKDIVLEHFNNMLEMYGTRACVIFRKYFHSYAKNQNNAVLYRNKVNAIVCENEMRKAIIECFGDSVV